MLKSRSNFKSSEEFRDRFIDTITAGVISRGNFISWCQIDSKHKDFRTGLEFYKSLGKTRVTDTKLKEVIKEKLKYSENPKYLISTGLQLLGHTGENYVSDRDSVQLSNFLINDKKSFREFEENLDIISDILVDLGLGKILNAVSLDDYFIGVQVGLETNRRKNVGGHAFIDVVTAELRAIVTNLNSKGISCSLKHEDRILYADGVTSKTVDYSIKVEGKLVGIEANFYTSPGSKPTEIKRSYGQVTEQLKKVGVELVWVTDGIGYKAMKKSLKEARDIHKNIYNLDMLRNSFEKDLEEYSRDKCYDHVNTENYLILK